MRKCERRGYGLEESGEFSTNYGLIRPKKKGKGEGGKEEKSGEGEVRGEREKI